MGLTGFCWDNASAESYFATLRTEFYYRRVWPTKSCAATEIGAWIEDHFNRRRRHSQIGEVSPMDFVDAILIPAGGSSTRRLPRVHEPGSRPPPPIVPRQRPGMKALSDLRAGDELSFEVRLGALMPREPDK